MSRIPSLRGLVLAAGAGTRFGGPKALARSADGTPWVARAVRTLTDAGCRDVLVALGAAASEAQALVPPPAETLVVEGWAEGLSATLRTALPAAAEGVDAVVLVPVDTPELPAEVVRRVVAAAGSVPGAALVQAVYRGEPGHPVLVGVDHVPDLVAGLAGDRGARPYLVAHGVVEVECGDLWSGADHDTP